MTEKGGWVGVYTRGLKRMLTWSNVGKGAEGKGFRWTGIYTFLPHLASIVWTIPLNGKIPVEPEIPNYSSAVRTWTDTSRAVWRDVPTAKDENGVIQGCSLGQRFVCAIWRSLLRRMGSEYSIHPLIQPCRFGSPPQSRVLPRFIDQQNFRPARCPPFGYDHKWHCCLSFIVYLTNCMFSGWNLWIQRALYAEEFVLRSIYVLTCIVGRLKVAPDLISISTRVVDLYWKTYPTRLLF